MQDVYLDVYGYRDDPLEDLEIPREKIPWLPTVFSAVDLLSSNLKRLEADCVQDLPDQSMATFFVYVVGFTANDTKSQTTKWLKVLFNLLEQPAAVHRFWLRKLTFKVEDSKDHRRLFRHCEESENLFLRVLTAAFNTVRALDLAEVEITNQHSHKAFAKSLASLFKVFEAQHESVVSTLGQDKTFLYMAGELVTMILNCSNIALAETLTSLARSLVLTYRITFANLLVEAEKSSQPKRLALLKELWMEGLH